MITLLIIISLLMFLLIGLLFIPISIAIDTKNNSYYIKLPGFFRIDLFFRKGVSPMFRFRVLFITFKVNILKQGKRKNKQKYEKSGIKPKTGKKIGINSSAQVIKAYINAFKVKRLNAEIDTGNFPLNEQLIPIASRINRQNINVSINFNNLNSADLLIMTQLFRFIRPTIKFYYN